ncbi:MAG TPA: ATP-grasp domain-containing protein [Candidatus Omnitrophota bacterium]|nr:ATP-grasp domain-containing protein [Candidatus Omnitrophota bacterium]
MKVGLTYDLKTDYAFKPNDPLDANAEFDHPETIDVIADAFAQSGYEVERIGNVSSLLSRLNDLKVDIVFNISEGLSGRNRESQVPILLEMAGIPCVGSDALTLAVSLDKIIAKKIFVSEGIPTPKFVEIGSPDRIDTIPSSMKFPLFVKPRCEGSSKGLSNASRVTTAAELKRQVELIVTKYRQPALVEEFIRGTEFTVAILGTDEPEVLPVVQIKIDGALDLKDKFYTFGHINRPDAVEYIVPAPVKPELLKRIIDVSAAAYRAIECRDFGRVDIRVDEKGMPYVLEINPLPSLSTEDVFSVIARYQGIPYPRMITRILECAIKRYGLK